jgi:hypothetical protein
MAGCAISSGGAFDCAAKKTGGIAARLLLYNWEDWILNTVTRDVDGTITDITNAVGKQAFDFSVADSGNLIPNCALRAVDGGQDGFDHQIDTKLFDLTQASRDNAADMRFAKVVAIYEKIDGTARLYGEKIGMRLSDWQENDGDPAFGNILQFILKTPDNDPPESEVPVTIDAGDQASTRTLLDGLTTIGV